MQILISLVGMMVLIALAMLLSNNRRKINRRTVVLAFSLQATIAALVLYVPAGGVLLDKVVSGVRRVIEYGEVGTKFVFGESTGEILGFTIALNVLPVIVFFSALMSTLYYLGIMQKVVAFIGGGLQRLLQTSRTESMSAASNIFVGHTEAPLVVKPYLATMSESELFAVMTGGCATIAGAVMVAYASMGVDLKFLVAASFMAAPGGLLMAKIIKPETDLREIEAESEPENDEDKPVNIFDAVGSGALVGLKLALNVGAMLLAFVAMIALLNGLISGVAGLFGYEDITLQFFLGQAFAPLAFVLGVPWSEAVVAGNLIGEKLVINEFYAYSHFVQIDVVTGISLKDTLSAHTQAIVTFALCGFANLSSIAILMGGLGGIVPKRRRDIARMGLMAVLAGMLANLMNAALAGFFLSLQGL
ncbi:MAG: NupC/NupG family nucleoside CNT transporter [Gammaproteobacteria bacterium]|nr:NupC/NupG family nucleoside CNT transporter [Gammaproteobacteria bacterium]